MGKFVAMLIITLILIALGLLNSNMDKTDDDGHVLTARWAEFRKASDADRPQKMLSVLSLIKEEAVRSHLPVDFYDAGKEYVNVSVSRNWKLRDSLNREFGREVEAFGEPIVTYTWMKEFGRTSTDERWEYVRTHPRGFQGKNRPFYRGLGSYMGGDLAGFIADDREYVLWDCLRQRQYSSETPEKDEIYTALLEKVKGRYPNEQFLHFTVAQRLPAEKRKAAMERLAETFKGTAMAFYPREVLMETDFQELGKKPSTEQEYKEFYNRCRAFEKERKALSGTEATIARSRTGVKGIIETLESKMLHIQVVGDHFRIFLRNLPSAKLTVRTDKKKVVLEKTLNNPKKSFYVLDTLDVPIPVLTDGSYAAEVVSSKEAASCMYNRNRLSLALRNESEGIAAYAAEHLSGRPVETGELVLWKGDTEVDAKTVRFDGFTRIPKSLQDRIGENTRVSYSLSVRVPDQDGLKKESERVYVSRYRNSYEFHETPDGTFCRIYRDRGAYNPGDTLKFKTVVSKGNLIDRLAVVPDLKLTAVLENAEGKEVSRIKLKTNDFGSASGEFALPVGERNGLFSLRIDGPGGRLGSTRFRVDEFILPTFQLTFDRNETLYLPGDEIRVSGKVAAFSGHSLTGARIENRVTRWGTVVHEETVVPSPDGSFGFTFKAMDPGNYSVESKVVDATGETLDFSTSYYVNDGISVSATLLGMANGTFTAMDEKSVRRYVPGRYYMEKSVLTGEILEADMSVRNSNGDEVPMEILYALLDERGSEVLSGKTASGEKLSLDLSGRPSGLYTLKVSARTENRAGEEIKDEESYRIFKIRESESILPSPLRELFIAGPSEVADGEKIRLRMGSADGEEWAVVTIFGKNCEVLETRRVHLDGIKGKKGSLTDLAFEYKASYPDAVRLQVFYFKYGRTVSFDREFRRRHDALVLPLSFISLTDKAFPGTEYTVRLKTDPGTEALVSVYDKSIDAIAPNRWEVLTRQQFSVPYVSVDAVCGSVTGEDIYAGAPKYGIDLVAPLTKDGKPAGMVVDETGAPVIGAYVSYVGTNRGSTTDPYGIFTLEKSGETLVEVSCIGYVTQRVLAVPGVVVVLKEDYQMLEETVVTGYGAAKGSARMATRSVMFSKNAGVAEEEMVMMDAVAPMAMPMESADNGLMDEAAEVAVREKFENALAFLPHLLSGRSGEIEFSFRTSDKLSTYHVDVYAHDKDMRNTFLRQDFVVTIPVKVSVNEPRYLYAGDNYRMAASVSNNSDAPVPGRLMLQVFRGGSSEPASVQALPLTVPAGGVAEGAFFTAVPSGIDTLVLKTVFLADDGSFSDAVRLEVPVKASEQTLTEAHSSVLRAGMDREALLAQLRKRFVNVDGARADLREIAIIDMVREAIPDHIDPRGDDVLSLSEAWYARKIASTVSALDPGAGEMPESKLLERILACRNSDGGFAWFEGMNSSPVITAVLMERFAKLRGLGFEVPDLSSSATYLDKVLFDRSLPYWCGWISYEQYLYARSFYASVPFNVTPATKTGQERLSDFRKWAKDYLVPVKSRGLSGQILGKARRIMTLRNLLALEGGSALAKDWGVKFGTMSKMRKSVEAEVVSLLEYAVEHRDGGWYYPNAVLPFRGLLESEAYAHSLLCDLLTAVRRDGSSDTRLDTVSDGIRLWLMLQKETQQWGDSPAYVDALTSVLNGSEAVLSTKVLALSATFTKPFTGIKSAGNGFTVERKFFRAVTVEEKYNDRTEDKNRNVTEYQEIRPGDPVHVGEKIFVRYEIWNQENRSFVRLTAPREAAFTPVDQLSGHYGWWLQPLRIDGLYSFVPQGYRNVKADRTEYYFDSYPEEKTTVTEEFFVTRSGSFTAPVVEIESLYAPHYRANGGFEGVLTADPKALSASAM